MIRSAFTMSLFLLTLTLVRPLAKADERSADDGQPIASSELIFEEVDGLVAVEAEHYFKQMKDDVRSWRLTTKEHTPDIKPDGDPNHVAGASGGAYLEALPDTRRTHGDKLIKGQNFANDAGAMAILSYKIHFNKTGRYYVWARTHSTGTEDNGLHIGIDGEWPASGQRMQWTAKKQWFWDSKQRTQKVHTGVPGQLYLDVKTTGEHIITFSMREDGFEFDKFLMTTDKNFARPRGVGPQPRVKAGKVPKPFAFVAADTAKQPMKQGPKLVQPRKPNGDGKVAISGELKQWHKVTLTMDGPFAHELDNQPNPFTDVRFDVTFTHESGKPQYHVPGYFAADGDAGETSAQSGTKWRAHLSPDKVGKWTYEISMMQAPLCALDSGLQAELLGMYDGQTGSFEIAKSDKTGRDLRGKGRLEYVGQHYLRFAGTGEYFLKAGADAPETLLGYQDFDGTVAMKKQRVPLKTYKPHLRDWNEGDPTWQNGKGKGLIGAINYLSGKGCNAFSFLTYNAGGDGDNVWPFVERNDKLHYDCSKLDQWQIVFDHGTNRGMYLHFKMQETENDDNKKHKADGNVRECFDGGELGPTRKLYCRELVARFAHELALNWNLGEENTQTTKQQKAMIDYIAELDPYDHNIVVHTFPGEQDKVYRALIGQKSKLTGTSLQNSNIQDTHRHTLKWVQESAASGKPWVVAFDESGSAAHGQCPDLGYRGFDGKDADKKMIYTQHEVRHQTLWGTLMAGGAGVEYYFGYKFAENDLVCEDWRSRDRSWDYCRIALNFFRDEQIPFWKMKNQNGLVGNDDDDNSRYCFAGAGVYVVYLADGDEVSLDLSATKGNHEVSWFNPREGGKLQQGSVTSVVGGKKVSLGTPPANLKDDWVVVVK